MVMVLISKQVVLGISKLECNNYCNLIYYALYHQIPNLTSDCSSRNSCRYLHSVNQMWKIKSWQLQLCNPTINVAAQKSLLWMIQLTQVEMELLKMKMLVMFFIDNGNGPDTPNGVKVLLYWTANLSVTTQLLIYYVSVPTLQIQLQVIVPQGTPAGPTA
jgi:hypothetical protein